MRLALALAVTLAAAPAHAALIAVDLAAPGDRLIARDTETGLEWLWIDAPAPAPELGFRLATPGEVLALIGAHGWDIPSAANLMNLVGATVWSIGDLVSDYGVDGNVVGGSIGVGYSVSCEVPGPCTWTYYNGFAPGTVSYRGTEWRVRAIPEPSTGGLVCIGLALLRMRRAWA